MPPPPRIVLLDVMATLVHDPFPVEVPAFFGLAFDELLEQKHPRRWIDFELGAIGEEDLLAGYFRDGRSFDGAGLKRAMRDAYRWLDGMEALVEELAGAGVEMHLLSNYPVWFGMIEDKLRLSRFASWRFVSCRTGVRKPDPEAYLGAARALKVEPGACLFIDDRRQNVAAAEQVGMGALLFLDATSLRGALVAHGLLEAAGYPV